MKEYQNLIGKIIIAMSIIIAAYIIAGVLGTIGGNIGSALYSIAGQFN